MDARDAPALLLRLDSGARYDSRMRDAAALIRWYDADRAALYLEIQRARDAEAAAAAALKAAQTGTGDPAALQRCREAAAILEADNLRLKALVPAYPGAWRG